MPNATSQPDEPIRAAVEQFLLRRLHGDTVTVSQFVCEFPDLGEALADHLRRAELIAGAKECSVDQRHEDLATDAPGSSRGQLSIRCPHCQTMVSIAADTVWAEVECAGCQQSFSLVGTNEQDSQAISELAHFDLLQRVGIGAFGTVWRARDRQLDRIVALKIPRKGQLSEREATIFMREAQAAAQIQHPHIVRVYEVGRHEDMLFIASEFIEGETLATRMGEHRSNHRDAATLAEKIARALQAAHTAGVVHRDLKPGNILMDESGEPHITDFGLAKRDTTDVTMTIDGALVGTPAYMAPEQAAGTADQADARSDIYSLGVILFQLLTGELPFRGSAPTMLKQVINDLPPSPRKLNHTIPRDLETICLKCLEKQPTRRFQTAEELADELGRFDRREPIQTRPVGVIGRLIRWSQRRPAAAVFATALLASLLLGTGVSLMFALRAEERSQQLLERNELLKSSAYAYEMTEVQRFVAAGNHEAALKMLGKYGDGSKEAHRRGPEWYHWWNRIHERQIAIIQTEHVLRGLAVRPSVAFRSAKVAEAEPTPPFEQAEEGPTKPATATFAERKATLVWGNDLGEIWVADQDLQHPRKLSTKHPQLIQNLLFSPDGKYLYSLCRGGELHVTDFDNDEVVKLLRCPGESTGAIALTDDGTRLAVVGDDADGKMEIDVWQTGTWQLLREIKGPKAGVISLFWRGNENELIAGGVTRVHQIRWEDDQSGPEVRAPNLEQFRSPRGCTSRFLEDETYIWTNMIDRTTLGRGNLQSGMATILDSDFRDRFTAELEVDAGETTLAAPTAQKRIHIFDLKTKKKRLVLSAHRNRVTSVEFLDDAATRLVSTGDDGSIRVWDIQVQPTRAAAKSTQLQPFRHHQYESLAVAEAAPRLAIRQGKQIHLLGLPELSRVAEIEWPFAAFGWSANKVAISTDGRHVAGVGANDDDPKGSCTSVAVWRAGDPAPEILPSEGKQMPSCIGFSPDGAEILVGHYSTLIQNEYPGVPCPIDLFRRDDLQLVSRWQPSDEDDLWRPHRMGITDLCASADSTRVYSVGFRDRTLKAWSYPDGELLWSYQPRTVFGARRVAVSRDHQTIAAGWDDSVITLHDPDRTLRHTLTGHHGIITGLSFSPDGRTLVSSSEDGQVKLWDTTIGQLRTTLTGHESPLISAAITHDGNYIVSMDENGELRVWDCAHR